MGECYMLEIALMVVTVLLGLVCVGSLSVWAWLMVKYHQYNRVHNSARMSGGDVARRILDEHGLQHIAVKAKGSFMFGNSYSHYFKKVRLRRYTIDQMTVTSLGIGAQKAALAILAHEGDPDMRRRIRLVPLITFGPTALIPLLLLGIVLDITLGNGSGYIFLLSALLGLLFYGYAIILTIATLRTEKKAQERAKTILLTSMLATDEELQMLDELFRLYNIQYVNDIILSSLELIYEALDFAVDLKDITSLIK